MARRVFFSFHYDNDVFRSQIVRNSWVTQGKYEAGFSDAAEFEKVKRNGTLAIKNWINTQLQGTSVTVVLIGAETLTREYVQYEIMQSYNKGNAIIGVRIHQLNEMGKGSTYPGNVDGVFFNLDDKKVTFKQIADSIHDYVAEDGYKNLGTWIEDAARKHNK